MKHALRNRQRRTRTRLDAGMAVGIFYKTCRRYMGWLLQLTENIDYAIVSMILA